jgi:hypothetical protein
VVNTDRWTTSLPVGIPSAPFSTATWSSHELESRIGTLRLQGIQIAGGGTVGIPILTGPGAKKIYVSAVDRGTNEVLANAVVPAGMMAWDLWKLEIPFPLHP